MNETLMIFGGYLNYLRMQYGISLRQLSRNTGLDVGYLSRIERCILNPPNEKNINIIAKGIGVKNNEREYLMDLSTSYHCIYPYDTKNNLSENINIPLLLRTVAGKKLSRNQVFELVQYINREYK